MGVNFRKVKASVKPTGNSAKGSCGRERPGGRQRPWVRFPVALAVYAEVLQTCSARLTQSAPSYLEPTLCVVKKVRRARKQCARTYKRHTAAYGKSGQEGPREQQQPQCLFLVALVADAKRGLRLQLRCILARTHKGIHKVSCKIIVKRATDDSGHAQ